MPFTLQIHRGTTAQWADDNKILGVGEPGVDTTAKILRIGDGITPWSSLPSVTGSSVKLVLNVMGLDKHIIGTGTSITVGDGVSLVYDVVHGLGLTDVVVQAYDLTPATPHQAIASIFIVDENTVRLVFLDPPDVASIRVVVTAGGGGPSVSDKGYVNHGADVNVARPVGFASVEWHGTVEPVNALNGDTWINE